MQPRAPVHPHALFVSPELVAGFFPFPTGTPCLLLPSAAACPPPHLPTVLLCPPPPTTVCGHPYLQRSKDTIQLPKRLSQQHERVTARYTAASGPLSRANHLRRSLALSAEAARGTGATAAAGSGVAAADDDIVAERGAGAEAVTMACGTAPDGWAAEDRHSATLTPAALSWAGDQRGGGGGRSWTWRSDPRPPTPSL